MAKKYIPLEKEVPSHDTMRRVFERIAPNQLKKALAEWVKVLNICLERKVVAIDGKTLRSSLFKTKSLAFLLPYRPGPLKIESCLWSVTLTGNAMVFP